MEITRDQINKELQDLRNERDAALRQIDIIQDCMNELMRKRKMLSFSQWKEESESMLSK
tara:strand:+ start:301 stop:477 length:177 start_codon:yes stop_codon:yes gene_type:complete